MTDQVERRLPKDVGDRLESGKAVLSIIVKLGGLAAAAWDGWKGAIPIPNDLRPLASLVAFILCSLALGLAAWRAPTLSNQAAVREVKIYAAVGIIWLGIYVTGIRYFSAYGPGPLAALTLDYVQQVAYATVFALFSVAFFAAGLLLSRLKVAN